MADALNLHNASSAAISKKETKEERKARVLARKKLRDAEKAEMKALEEAARKKKLLEDKKHDYEDRELTAAETIDIAERGAKAIKSGAMFPIEVWFAETQVRHGGFHDSKGLRRRTFDCLGYNQRNIVSEAAAEGHTKALRMMLEAGAASQQHDGTGLTALHLALVNKHMDCAGLLVMHDTWKEWKYEKTKKKLKKQKKGGLMVEGKEQVREDANDSYKREFELKVKNPQCKAVLETTMLRCPDEVVENGFCAKQSCKMQGFEMVKKKMEEGREKGENFDAYLWNKNPHEKLVNSKSIAVARGMKMHHVVTIVEGLVRFSRRAFFGLLDVVDALNVDNVDGVAKSLKKVISVFKKRKQVGVQPTKKGVRNPLHDDLISLHGLLAAYVGSPQTPHIHGTTSVGAHVAQLIGLMVQQGRRNHPRCWSLQCERECEMLIMTATDDTGVGSNKDFKEGTGLWRDEDTESDWIADVRRIEKEQVRPKMGCGWDAEGYLG